MKRDERNEFVVHLLCAERELAAAVSGLEGTDAAIETSVNALSRALDAIDAALSAQFDGHLAANIQGFRISTAGSPVSRGILHRALLWLRV